MRSDSSASRHIPLRAAFLLALVNVLWAGSAVNAKNALTAVGPYTLAVIRFAPSAALLYLAARLRGDVFAIRRADWWRFVFFGAVGIALTYGLFYNGIEETTASESTLLIASEPILIAIVAHLFLREQLRAIQWLGLGIGFAGIYLIIAQGLLIHLNPSAIGNAIVMLSLTFECSASVLGKRLTYSYPGLVVVTVEMAIGTLFLAPFATAEFLHHPPGPFPLLIIANLVYVSLGCSVFCYGIWFWLMERYDVSALAGFLFIQPMMGPLLGWAFRGERMGPWTIGGAALVVTGVWLVAIAGRPGKDAHGTMS